MSPLARWIATVVASLITAFLFAALSYHYGLPLIQTEQASADRVVLAGVVATVVGAVVALPLAWWAGREKPPSSRPASGAVAQHSATVQGVETSHIQLRDIGSGAKVNLFSPVAGPATAGAKPDTVSVHGDIRFAGPGVVAGKIKGGIHFHESTATLPARSSVRSLPRDLADFTGRDPEIAQLVDALKAGSRNGAVAVAIHAIDGMAGIGKTTLAVHFAHQMAADYHDLFFLDLRAHTKDQLPMDPGEALEILLTTIGIRGKRIPALLEARAARWRTELADRKALLILDNAASAEQVRPLLPGSSGCFVLITSRARLMGLDGVSPLTLDTLNPDDAVELFTRIVGPQHIADDLDLVSVVVRRCGFLPLAIRLAAAWLRHHRAKSVTDLLDRFTDTLGPVLAAFHLSYCDLDEAEQLMFRRLGLHPGLTFTGRTAAVLADVTRDRALTLLNELYERHLIKEPAGGRYQFHDLIRDYARTLAHREDSEFEREAAVRRLLGHYLAAVDEQMRAQDFAWFDDELPNLLPCARNAIERADEGYAWQLPRALAVVLQMRGLYRQARTLHLGALDAAHAHGDHLGEAGAHMELAIVDRETGDHQAACTHARRALDLYADSGDLKGRAGALAELGVLDRETGDHTAARTHLTQALDLYTDLHNAIGQANAFIALGVLDRETGDYEAARVHIREALELYAACNSRLGQANAHYDLGILDRLAQAYLAARDQLTTALRLYTEIHNQAGCANAHVELGDLASKRRELAEARQHWRASLDLYVVIESPRAEDVRQRLRENRYLPSRQGMDS